MAQHAIKVCDAVMFFSSMSGGIKRYVQEKIQYLLDSTPHEHCLIIPSHRDAVTRLPRRSIYEIRSPRLVGSASYRILMHRRKILEAIRAERPDIIEVDNPYRTPWIALAAGREAGIPVVAFYHSDYPRALERTILKYAGDFLGSRIAPLIDRYLLRLYNRMSATVVSSGRFRDTLEGIGINNVKVIPLGTNPRLFRPRRKRERILRELGLDSDARLLLFVGRLAREKNISRLFDMMDQLRDEPQRHHLLLIGDGELREKVIEKTQEVDYLTWNPFTTSQRRLVEFYSAADLFVHAGQSETFGLVALEAQCCGTRVLGVRGGGLDEALQYESPQVLADDASGPALADAVRRIWELRETDATRDARHERTARHFSWNTTFDQLVALYLQLVEKSRAARSDSANETADSAVLTR